MTDPSSGARRRLFVVFAEASRDLAAPVVRAFEAAGFDVQQAATGQGDVAADGVDAVVVCWTPAAVANDMVGLAAGRAQRAGKLFAIMLAPCRPPRSIDSSMADLTGWGGDPGDPAFLRVVQSLHARLSGQVIGGRLPRLRYLSWGGAGAVSLAAVAFIANAGGLKEAYDSFANPGASERTLSVTEAKVDEVLTLLKGKSGGDMNSSTEAALRESIERLLTVQSGARGRAADKLFEGDVEGALADLRAAAQEGEKAAAGLAETWNEIGALNFPTDTWAAVDAYERSIALAPNDAVARSQLGNLYIRAGFLDEAELAFQHILDISGSTEPEWRALAAGSLGQIAMRRGNLDEAEEFLNQALAIDREVKSLEGEAADLADLGRLHQERGDLRTAESHLRKAIDLQVKAMNHAGEADALCRLGAVLLERDSRSEAETVYTKALDISTIEQDIEGMAFATAGLGDVAADAGKVEQANLYYSKALDLAQQISSSAIQAATLTRLGGLAEDRGDKTEAIELLRDAMLIYRMMGLENEARDIERRLRKNGATPSPEGPER